MCGVDWEGAWFIFWKPFCHGDAVRLGMMELKAFLDSVGEYIMNNNKTATRQQHNTQQQDEYNKQDSNKMSTINKTATKQQHKTATRLVTCANHPLLAGCHNRSAGIYIVSLVLYQNAELS